MRRSLSSCLSPRHLGVSIATSLCAGALLASPALTPVYAAPTVGGDENGPQVQILQPGYQDVLKGKTKILIAVKSQKFNPQFVEMFIDDKPATSGPISLSTLPSAQYDWDTKLFADGPHKLTVRITDTQGFRGWAEVNVYLNNDKKVDSVPPSLNWRNVSAYQQLSGKAQIQLDAIDNFGVKWIIVSVNPASDPNRKPALRSWLLNRPPYTVNFDTTTVEDGLYKLTAKAWDSYEQEGKASSLTLGVVNSGVISATTVGDMLKGMQKMDEANSQPIPSTNNKAPKFTVPIPDEAAAPNPYTQKSSGASAAKPTTATPNVVVKQSAVAPKNQVAPSIPPMIVRDTKPAVKAPALVAKADTNVDPNSVAAPQLSNRSNANIASATSTLSNEIDAAVSDDWRGRQARAALPEGDLRGMETSGQLSAAKSTKSVDLGVSRSSAAALASESESRSFHAAVPIGTERTFVAAASLHPESEMPTLSQTARDAALRVAAVAPLKVEADAVAPSGRVANPKTLVARALPKADVAAPSLSRNTEASSLVASRENAKVSGEVSAPQPSRLAAPSVAGERGFNGTQISGAAAAPRTAVSPRLPLLARNDEVKTARSGKAAEPNTRIAALPRPTKSNQRGAINAITVSPLEVKTSDAIPAFHVAARASDLRAVAARYGLPVEVVAACNSWPANKTLTAGEKVMLPQQLKVSYQGVPVKGDAPSMLVGGTGVTAFRFMFQQAGGKLEWDAKKQRVIARKGESEVVLTIGSNKAKVGDKDVMMELAAFLFEGRTMVPVRFFEEGLHAQVEWDPQTGRLVVAMAN